MRSACHYSKATRLSPDKWTLPSERPQNGGKEEIKDVMKVGSTVKTKIEPTNKNDASNFVENQVNTLVEHTKSLCDKIDNAFLPIYPVALYASASPLPETSQRQHQIVLEIIVVVQREPDGSMKTHPDYAIVAPVLDNFRAKRKIGWGTKNLNEYLPTLLEKKLPNIPSQERKRLVDVFHPWLAHLTHWNDFSAFSKQAPWHPERLTAHLVKSNLNIKISLATESPKEDENIQFLYERGGSEDDIEEIVRRVTKKVGKDIIAVFE